MYKYTESIGEPENSQDTPLRNTTPAGKRRVNRDPRLTPAKKGKQNQCQALFDILVSSRLMEDIFDPNFNLTNKCLIDIKDSVNNNERCIQDTKEDNDELLLLIQQLTEKSAAAEQSQYHLGVEVSGHGTKFGKRQSKSADIDMPAYDEYQDELIVQGSTKVHDERVDALKSAIKSNEMIKQQVEDFKKELRQIRADLPAQVDRLRLEYEARLNQQRRELKNEAQDTEKKVKHELDKKQRIIDKISQTATSARQAKSADTEAAIAGLSSKLAAAVTAERDAVSDLSAINKTLEVVTQRKAHWKACAQLQTRQIESLDEDLLDAQHSLDETQRSLLDSNTRAMQTKEQLDVFISNYATLLTNVALVQRQKLSVARSQKAHLGGYLVQARSIIGGLQGTIDGLHAKLNARARQLERRNEQLTQKNNLLVSKDNVIDHLGMQLKTKDQSLLRKDKTMSQDQVEIRRLKRTNVNLDGQLKAKDDRLALNVTELSGKVQETRNLKEQAAATAKELASQRSLNTQQAQRIDELQWTIDQRNAAVTQLDSKLDRKQSQLDRSALIIVSQNERVKGLGSNIESLLQEKTEAELAMQKLREGLSSLKSDLDTTSDELTSQSTLITQKDAKIGDLENTNMALSRAQTEAKGKIDDLQVQLSDLTIEMGFENAKMASQISAAALKDKRIQGLETTIADQIALVDQRDAKIRDLEDANMGYSRSQAKANWKLENLQNQVSKLDLKLRVKSEELDLQTAAADTKDKRIQALETTNEETLALVAQRDAEVRDLDATNASLSQEQVRTIGRMNILQAQVSKLDLEMTAKNEELIAQTTAASLKDGEIRRLADTQLDLLRAQEKAKDDKAHLQLILELADGKIENLEANLSTRDRELYDAVAETKHTRQTLEEVADSLSAEKTANRTASLEILLKRAEDGLQAISADLNDHRKNLEKERSKNGTLADKVECLEEARLRCSTEKEISDRKMKELVEMVSLNQLTIRDLEADAASKSTLLGQLQNDRTIYDTERACLLQQLMAESARSHCVKEELPKSLAGVFGNTQDVQVLLGEQADETVLIRVQRFLNEQMAFIILEKSDHTRTFWYESLDRCIAYTAEWDCYLRLKKGPEETTIEVRIHGIDSEVLEGWLKGAD